MIEWSVRAPRSTAKSTGVLLAYAVAFLLGTLLIQSPIAGLLGVALVFGGTAEYWLPVSFRIDQKGAQRRLGLSVTSMQWSEVKWQGEENGELWLSPIANPSGRLASLRGVRLVLTPDNADQVRSAVAAALANATAEKEGAHE